MYFTCKNWIVLLTETMTYTELEIGIMSFLFHTGYTAAKFRRTRTTGKKRKYQKAKSTFNMF